jgi:hypothetical protein
LSLAGTCFEIVFVLKKMLIVALEQGPDREMKYENLQLASEVHGKHATNSLFLNLCHCTFVGDGKAKKRAEETIETYKV